MTWLPPKWFLLEKFHRPQLGIQASVVLLRDNKMRVSWQTLWSSQYLNWKFRRSSINAFQQLRSIQLLNWHISLCCASVLENSYKLQRSKEDWEELEQKKKNPSVDWQSSDFNFNLDQTKGSICCWFTVCICLSFYVRAGQPQQRGDLAGCRQARVRKQWIRKSEEAAGQSSQQRSHCSGKAVRRVGGPDLSSSGELGWKEKFLQSCGHRDWPTGSLPSSFCCSTSPANCDTKSRHDGKKKRARIKWGVLGFLHKWQKSGNSQFTDVCVVFVLHKGMSWKKKKRENAFTEELCLLC